MTTLPAEPVERWKSADLEALPQEEGKRYEIVDGELFVSNQPHWYHQETCANITVEINLWARANGEANAVSAPGVIFDDENDVAPDVVWVRHERLVHLLGESGHIHGAPDLAVEVLSPGSTNERRDRMAKLRLYSSRGVREYWLVDWRNKTLEVYRREEAALKLNTTLYPEDELTSPLLPGFKVSVARLLPE